MHDLADREEPSPDIYRLLANCYQPPDQLNMETLEAIHQHIAFHLQEGTEAAAGMIEAWPIGEEGLNSLRIVHAKLFVGPFDLMAPPYGSVYLDEDRRTMGDSTMDVIRIYAESGLDPHPEVHEPPDHITTELEFLCYLGYQTSSGPEEELNDLRKRFIANHLKRWIPQFAARIVDSNLHDFYKHLAILTSLAVHAEATRLGVSQNLDSGWIS